MIKNIKKIRRIIMSAICLAFVFVICTGAVYDSGNVDVVITEINRFKDSEITVNVKTKCETVGDVLSENCFEISVYDKINLLQEKPLEHGEQIVIERGIPITITCNEIMTLTSTTHTTISEALSETGMALDDDDYSSPSADNAVYENLNISIVRVDNAVEEHEETVEYKTIYKEDNSIYEGQQKVSVKGVNGVVKVTENVVYENGTEISRTENSRETITEKVDEVILKGTKKKTSTPKSTSKSKATGNKNGQKSEESSSSQTETKTTPSGLNYKKKLTMNATAYSAFKKGGGYGVTASGRTARYGVVAVDPKVIPLGTNLYIEGYGYAVAADTGGAIKGNKIDLCFEKSNSELRKFGRKNVTVYILD